MSTVEIDTCVISEFCRKHHIRKLSLFGSRMRGEHRAGSDMDLLVEFEPGNVPGFAFASIQRELSELFGVRVDLRTPGELNRRFRDDVSRNAEPLYAAD